MKTEINITDNDIRYGTQEDDNSCAIAKVIKRKVKHRYRSTVSVTPGGVTISEDHEDLTLPVAARHFIGKFDDNKKSVRPFSFILDIPEQFLRGCRRAKAALLR